MKKALILSLLFNILIVAVYGVRKVYYTKSSAPVSPSDWSVSWNKQRTDLFSAVPVDSGEIVFIGDSHIERFLLNDYYPGKRIRNRGIGSNTSGQVLARIDEVVIRKPSKIFFQVGINDLAFGYSADTTYSNIIRVVGAVDRTKTTPYVISLFPTRAQEGHLNDLVQVINGRLSDYCIRNNIAFINIYPLLLKDGELNSDFTIDETHLNGKGYNILKNEIDKYL
jgi:lysophospholipase L1-like esterase